jgi:hypothetical protein
MGPLADLTSRSRGHAKVAGASGAVDVQKSASKSPAVITLVSPAQQRDYAERAAVNTELCIHAQVTSLRANTHYDRKAIIAVASQACLSTYMQAFTGVLMPPDKRAEAEQYAMMPLQIDVERELARPAR